MLEWMNSQSTKIIHFSLYTCSYLQINNSVEVESVQFSLIPHNAFSASSDFTSVVVASGVDTCRRYISLYCLLLIEPKIRIAFTIKTLNAHQLNQNQTLFFICKFYLFNGLIIFCLDNILIQISNQELN